MAIVNMKLSSREPATLVGALIVAVILACVEAFLPLARTSLKIPCARHFAASNKSRDTQSTKPTAKRKSKYNVNDIVKGMGLQPVSTSYDANHTATGRSSGAALFETPKMVKPASSITIDTQLTYSRNGHAVMRDFVDPGTLKKIRKELQVLMVEEEILAWRQKVQVASNSVKLASSCETVSECQAELKKLGIPASLPFLQHFNTFRRLKTVRALAFSLGEAASILLDVPKVRLYQDSVFWKRVGDGPTPWHVDARMAPFDTSHFVTFWVPLQDIPKDGTALLFCSKSHIDFSLPYWNAIEKSQDEDSEWNRLEHRYPKDPVHYMPMKVGDLTVHSGWTLHCADGAEGGASVDRMALAISFVDAKAELRLDSMDDKGLGDNEDRWSYQDWVHSVPPRQPFQHEFVPIVWPR